MKLKSICLGVALLLLIAFLAFYLQPKPYQLVLDSSYEPTALNLISNSRTSIYLAVYSIKYYPDYPESNSLLWALCNASSRGVSVNVLADNELDSNMDAVRFLENCGVNARLDSSKTRLHAKFLVVDGELVLLGSTNWSYSSLNKNKEVNVLIRDKELASVLISYFSRI